jgi:hypothetical protein
MVASFQNTYKYLISLFKKSIPKKEMACFPKKTDHFDNWLPVVDALRNQLAKASKEVISTILIAQNQVKDGFLVPYTS